MEIKVMHQVMAWNEDVSDAVKAELSSHRVCLINVMGSPGAGKTTTLISLIDRLRPTTPALLQAVTSSSPTQSVRTRSLLL